MCRCSVVVMCDLICVRHFGVKAVREGREGMEQMNGIWICLEEEEEEEEEDEVDSDVL